MSKILINWDEYYSVGYDLIDEQHKKLVDMINELYSSFILGEAQEKAQVIVEEMIKYTDYHFKTEENFFDEYNYPETQEHKNIHASFVNKAVELKEGLESGQITVSYDIMNFLRQWLIDHILKEDKKFAKFFSEKGIKLEL
ncbi:MAG: bacteriohemerythrin [Bacteroidales bacterium]|nr:bacteriohemerythrin [Bacteroidales bacterium]